MQTWILQDLVKRLEWVEALAYVAQHHLVVPCKKILGTSRGYSSSRDRSDPEGIGGNSPDYRCFAVRSHTWGDLGRDHH